MTTKKKVFISFDCDHDEDTKILLTEQARLPDSPFDITDASERVPLTGDWGDRVRRRMDNIDVVIVMCGQHAYLATGMAAELTIAQEKNKPYFLLTAYANIACTRPTSAWSSDKAYEWTWVNLKTLIGGLR
jgi:hypothetical protein